MKTVAVFFGGKSNEHEISVITGMYCVNLLRGGEWKILPVYLPREGGMLLADADGVEEFRKIEGGRFLPVLLEGRYLRRAKRHKPICRIDCALNCCHGGAGEDGTLSALLRWNQIPSASPDAAVSALFMNKSYSKIAARGMGIPVAPSFTVGEWDEDFLPRAEEAGYPLIVKPACLGSSIGIRVAENGEELEKALELAFALDHSALVEKYFPHKRDINCAAYRKGGEIVVSACEEVFSDEKILTFAEKYEGAGERNSRLPADLPEEVSEKIRGYTRLIYETFGVRGVVRADFLVVDGEVYFNELNTVPGSLATYLFGERLCDARDFLCDLVREGLGAREGEKRTVRTGILDRGVFSGGKSCKRR